MAERRMFAKTIIDSDAFLDMPLSAQALYFHLSMRADDDGFVNNPKKIQRLIGASDDDLKLLALKSFLIPFETGIVVIKHWKIHNYIRGDRKHDTKYSDEMALLTVKENGAYSIRADLKEINNSQMSAKCQSSDNQVTVKCPTEVRLGKDSIGKDSIGKDSNICPEPKQVDSEQTDKTVYADVSPIPLNDKTEWRMPLELYEEFAKTYPAVDIKEQVSRMRMWCLSSPSRKKTRRGVVKFVNNWLSGEQDGANKKNRIMNTGSQLDSIKV